MPVSVVNPSSGGGRAPGAGRLLWAWNRTDTSQFDSTSIVHQRDIGSAAGSITLSHVADAWQGQPVLRVAGTIQGGHVMPVKESEIALPERYVVEARIRRISVSTNHALCAMFFHESAGVVNGLYYSRSTGSSSGAFSGVKNDLQSVGLAGGSFGVGWNAAAEGAGGGHYLFEVWRQTGENPCRFAVRAYLSEATGHARAAAYEGSTTFTEWNGLSMGRIGLGMYCGGSAAAGEVDFLDLAVYEHPMDA